MDDIVIKIREGLPTIAEMFTLDTLYRCSICGVLIGEPCYNEGEAINCFGSREEFEAAYGVPLSTLQELIE